MEEWKMAELWDVYDINRNKIGKKIERENIIS